MGDRSVIIELDMSSTFASCTRYRSPQHFDQTKCPASGIWKIDGKNLAIGAIVPSKVQFKGRYKVTDVLVPQKDTITQDWNRRV